MYTNICVYFLYYSIEKKYTTTIGTITLIIVQYVSNIGIYTFFIRYSVPYMKCLIK